MFLSLSKRVKIKTDVYKAGVKKEDLINQSLSLRVDQIYQWDKFYYGTFC